MAILYKITDWTKRYENAQSRKLVHIRWYCNPNRWDSKGYRRLARRKDKVAVFCGWTLIQQIASRMPERGTLADEDGVLTPDDMADMTGFPAGVFETALDVLSAPEIRWLQRFEVANPPTSATHPPTSATHPPTSAAEGKGREGKGREEKEPPKSPKGDLGWEKVCGLMQGDGLRCPEFRDKWAEWVRHRTEIRKNLTPSTVAKQIRTLEGWGFARAVAAIDQSIEKGWTGLFEPGGNNGKSAKAATPELDKLIHDKMEADHAAR